MTFAITAAAQTTAPVTWTHDGNIITVNWPTNYHAAYADAQHTATVTQLADAPTSAVPATATEASTGSVIGLSGATLLGVILVVWAVAKWRHGWSKDAKTAFLMGAAAAVLVGSWGLFGQLTGTIKSTGDSVGNSVGNTFSQQSGYTSR